MSAKTMLHEMSKIFGLMKKVDDKVEIGSNEMTHTTSEIFVAFYYYQK